MNLLRRLLAKFQPLELQRLEPMADEALLRSLRCDENQPLWLGIMEVLRRTREDVVDQMSDPDLPQQTRLDGLTAIWTVKEITRRLQEYRAVAVAKK